MILKQEKVIWLPLMPQNKLVVMPEIEALTCKPVLFHVLVDSSYWQALLNTRSLALCWTFLWSWIRNIQISFQLVWDYVFKKMLFSFICGRNQTELVTRILVFHPWMTDSECNWVGDPPDNNNGIYLETSRD